MFTVWIFAIVCFLLIVCVLSSPVIRVGRVNFRVQYWMMPMFGAILLIASGHLPVEVVWAGLTSSGSINPLKILILFISMTMLSIFLDEAGMFAYLASVALKFAGSSQIKLFLILMTVVSVLTVFTSNDIIILTFTPFICYFSKNAQIDPMPYLFGEFVAANTFSMMLIIGNPTNIYLASAQGIGFFEYISIMGLPTLAAGLSAMVLLLLIFNKPLKKKASIETRQSSIKDKVFIVLGVLHLGICTVLLILSSYIGLEMWYITLGFAVSLFVCVTIYKKVSRVKERILLHTLARSPWELIPFVLSMFMVVLALEESGVCGSIATHLGDGNVVYTYGITSFLAANLMNNIPMSVLYSSVVKAAPEAVQLKACFASIVGSNLGAYFTPLGALAGIMWSGILKRMGISLSFGKYIRYGVCISVPVLLITLLVLKFI